MLQGPEEGQSWGIFWQLEIAGREWSPELARSAGSIKNAELKGMIIYSTVHRNSTKHGE